MKKIQNLTRVSILYFLKTVSLVFIVLFVFSCSNDDDTIMPEQQEEEEVEDTPTEVFIEAGEVMKYEVVSLEIENIPSESLEGTVNDNTITVVKSSDNSISLLIDDNFEIGENILEIPSLDNKIRFKVSNAVLINSVEETLDELSSNFDTYAESINGDNNTPEQDYVISAIENYKSTLQQLSPEEREVVALTYQANKAFFDQLYQIDYTVPKQKVGKDYSGLSYKDLARNFALATIGAGSATFLAVASFSSIPIVTLPLAIAAITLWGIVRDIGYEAINRTQVLYDQFQFGDFVSTALQKNNSALEFNSEVPQQIPFKTKTRSINSSDSNNQNTIISSIFTSTSELNTVIDRLNSVITVVNKIPFTNISSIDYFSIPSEPQYEPIEITQEIFSNILFTIENSNLNLNNVSFENGLLNLTITILDDSGVEEFVESSITYALQDDTNDLTGSLPVKVFKDTETQAQDIEIVSGNDQTARQGDQLSEPLVVVVKDNEGNVVSGQEVIFSITNGGGSLSQEKVITDSNGNAQTNWTLVDSVDSQTVEASISDDEGNIIDSISFSATATNECTDNEPPTITGISYTCKKRPDDPADEITFFVNIDFTNGIEDANFEDYTIVVTNANGGGYDEKLISGTMNSGTFEVAVAGLKSELSTCSPNGGSSMVLKEGVVYMIDPCGDESNKINYRAIVYSID